MKQFIITPDGEILTTNPDLLPIAELGRAEKRRASHIVPAHPARRVAFRILRRMFGDTGPVPDWCRTWNGPWQVRWAESPRRVAFQHPSRRVCLKWEIETLNARLAQ